MSTQTVTHHDCFATWTDDTLVVGNSRIRREWSIADGLLTARRLDDCVSGRLWLSDASPQPAPAPAQHLPGPVSVSLTHLITRQAATCEEALMIGLEARSSEACVTTWIRIFPGLAAISTWMANDPVSASDAIASTCSEATGGEERADVSEAPVGAALGDLLMIDHRHRRFGAVAFRDHSDSEDGFVSQRVDLLTIAGHYRHEGNLFWIEDQRSGDGLVMLAEAPQPRARPTRPSCDLAIAGGALHWYRPVAGSGDSDHPSTILLHQDGQRGRREVLHRYQRAHRRWVPERDALLWHSIWGDRHRDGRMCEGFLRQELERLDELGMDFLYLIDGWQRGASTNSVVAGGCWSAQWDDPHYWDPHPERFPDGLSPLLDEARRRGFHLGMWYNPDSSADYANWQRDASLLLRMHERYGISWVKFDGVLISSDAGEANLRALMAAVVDGSDGAMAIELDLTAGRRWGYWSAMSYGVIFLENRYTDWGKWWPHCTLRNLWQLAHWVDPRRLRIEFLNQRRNKDRYGDDPLAPDRYTLDHCFAITLAANPLAWLEASGLDDAQVAELGPAIAAWKRHRHEMQAALVAPMLDEPDGFSWSGFDLRCEDGGGHLLLFRGLSPSAEISVSLPAARIQVISGDCEAPTLNDGRLDLRIARTPGYAWLRYEI